MALVISDRVKETSITSGTGSVTLAGAFGGFQSFLAAVGNGNQTYYTIENDTRWEVGIGTYTTDGNTLSRDTVLSSSNSDDKISLDGVSVVFCTLPAAKTLFKDVADELDLSSTNIQVDNLYSSDLVASGTIGCSGLLTLRRESAGNFFHAYTDDSYDETISLHTDSAGSPEWKLGLKGSPSSVTDPPTYAYIHAQDGNVGFVANSLNSLSLSHGGGLVATHKGTAVLQANSAGTGVQINSSSSSHPALTVTGGVSLATDIQQWRTSAGTVLSVVTKDGNIGIGTDSSTYELDVVGDIGLNQYIYHNGDTNTYIRFRGDQIDFVAGGRTMLTLDEASNDKVIINNSKADVDFQVEGDGDQYLIYTDAANDRVGIGTNEPAYKLDVVGTGRMSSVIFAGDSTEQTTAFTNQDVLVSGWASTQILANSASGVAISGWADATFMNAGTVPAQILANSSSGVAISGWAKAYVDTQDHTSTAVSGWAASSFSSHDGLAADVLANSASGVAISGWAGKTITNEVNSLVDAAPGALNTLNELAAALDDDASFATTITNSIAANTTKITANSVSGVAISGWAKSYVDTQDHSATAVSGWAASDLTSISGVGGTIDSVSGWASGTFMEATPTFFYDKTNTVLAINTSNPTTSAGGSPYYKTGLDVNGHAFVSGQLAAGSVVVQNGSISASGLYISGDGNSSYATVDNLVVLKHADIRGSETLQFVKMSGVSGVMDQVVFQNERPADQAIITRNHVTQTANLFETQNANSGVLMSIDPSGSVFSSGTISASGGLLFRDLVPNDTSLKLYNDGGTLKFNGSAIDAVASGWAASELTSISGVGGTIDSVSGWASGTFLTEHPNISAASSSDNSGRTYIQDITLDSNGHITALATATETVTDTNTQLTQEQVEDYVGGMLDGTETFISVSYDDGDGNIDFVVPVKDEDDLTSNSDTHLATQQSIKAYVDAQSHTDTTYTGSSGVHLVGTDFRTSGVGIFNVIEFGEEAASDTSPIRIGNSTGETGDYSIAIGKWALSSTTPTATGNVAIGLSAGKLLNEASDTNVLIGYRAGESGSGNANIELGWSAGYLQDGDFNFSAGYAAGYQATGNYNIYIGQAAGFDCEGNGNLDINKAGLGVTSAMDGLNEKINIFDTIRGDHSTNRIAIGGNLAAADYTPDATLEVKPKEATDVGIIVQADAAHTANFMEFQNSSEFVLAKVEADGSIATSGTVSASGGMVIDENATLEWSDDSVRIGEAGHMGGLRNISIGQYAGKGTNGGDYNIGIGRYGGYSAGGDYNVAVGYKAGYDTHSTSDHNYAIGYEAGRELDGEYNISVGYQAGYEGGGDHNVGISYQAGYGSDGDYNISLGYQAGYSMSATSDYNLCLGRNAGRSADGDFNVFLGTHAGYDSDGERNIYIGYQAGFEADPGSNNIEIITNSSYGVTSTLDGLSNKINIENTIMGDTAANKIVIGSGTTAQTANYSPSATLEIKPKLITDTALSIQSSGVSDVVKVYGTNVAVSGRLLGPISSPVLADTNATVNVTLSAGNYHEVELAAAVTKIIFQKGTAGQKFAVRFSQPAGANYTIAWTNVDVDEGGTGGTVSWAGGTAPTMTATNAKADTYGFIQRSATAFDGFVIGQNI